MKLYLTVVLCQPEGKPETRLEITGLSTNASSAARRARWTVISSRQHGDVDEVSWVSVEEVPCKWFALCPNTASGYMDGGPLGEVPICTSCKEKAERLQK